MSILRKFIIGIFSLCIFSCSEWFLTEIEQDCNIENPQYTFNAEIKPIFDQYCIQCHNSNYASADLSLANFEDFNLSMYFTPGDSNDGLILERIENAESPMPPAGFSPMNTEDILILKTWILECAVEN